MPEDQDNGSQLSPNISNPKVSPKKPDVTVQPVDGVIVQTMGGFELHWVPKISTAVASLVMVTGEFTQALGNGLIVKSDSGEVFTMMGTIVPLEVPHGFSATILAENAFSKSFTPSVAVNPHDPISKVCSMVEGGG